MARFMSSREPEARLVKWLQQAARALVVEATAQWAGEDHQNEQKTLKASPDNHVYFSEVWSTHPGVIENSASLLWRSSTPSGWLNTSGPQIILNSNCSCM